MLRTDLFLLWNRISHISLYLLPVNLFYPAHAPGSDCIYQKKEVSSLFTHYWLPILLILIASHIHLNLISWNRPIFLFISQNIINHLLIMIVVSSFPHSEVHDHFAPVPLQVLVLLLHCLKQEFQCEWYYHSYVIS